MKTKILWMAAGLAAACAVAGCVQTVTDKQTVGIPLIRDSMEGQYDRSVEQVFQAAKKVLDKAGTVTIFSTLPNQTNLVRTLEAKVNQRNVYVRIEAVSPNITALAVQTRTPGGATDLTLAQALKEEIALALVGTR
jgi:hypothetical protein